jgi:CHAD domain-containing protein
LLGAARDSDVLVAYARRKRFRAWAQRKTNQSFDKRQARDHRRLVRHLVSQRFQGLIEGMKGWIERGLWLRRWERNSRGKSAKPLKAYSERELNRLRQRLIRKGRRLESLGASGRHRLRIGTKRLRYMLEALTDIVSLHDRAKLLHLHKSAKRLQQALGDLRDLKRLARLGVSAKGCPAKKLPNYRRHRKKLLRSAAEALRSIKHAGRF